MRKILNKWIDQYFSDEEALFLFLILAAFDDHHRVDNVAERFTHLAALLIQGETVREHSLVGRMAIDRHRCEQ